MINAAPVSWSSRDVMRSVFVAPSSASTEKKTTSRLDSESAAHANTLKLFGEQSLEAGASHLVLAQAKLEQWQQQQQTGKLQYSSSDTKASSTVPKAVAEAWEHAE